MREWRQAKGGEHLPSTEEAAAFDVPQLIALFLPLGVFFLGEIPDVLRRRSVLGREDPSPQGQSPEHGDPPTEVSAESITVEGSFLLVDEDESFSDSCSGSGGHGDIQSNTAVVVRDIRENVITRIELGTGEGDGSTCLFTFEFEVVEVSDGGDGFVVAVGDRGESTYSFEELEEPDTVGLVLGLD